MTKNGGRICRDSTSSRLVGAVISIQVNGKVRDRVDVSADITSDEATELAMASEKVQSWLDGHEVKRVIARPPNLVNIVVG